eukprot:4644697-Amphidinium_carterae.2
MTPALPSEVSAEHSIAGTAVLVKKCVGMSHLAAPGHPLLRGRVCAALVNAILRKGLLVVSIYLDVRHTQAQVLEELAALCAWVKEHRHGFLIAGDFNVEPNCLFQARWGEMAPAGIVTCNQATCSSGKEIDYFAIHLALLARHPVARLYGLSCVKPHSAVSLLIDGAGHHDVIRVQRKKKPFSEIASIGPEPYQELPTWASDRIVDIDAAWQEWSLRAEQFLCCRAGHACDAAWCGRGRGLKVRHTPLHKFIWTQVPHKTSLLARA